MTQRTRSELNSDADSYLPDNTAGEISPADVRQRVKDLADSSLLPEDVSAFIQTLLDDADAAAARTTLGLVIGTNVQAYDADLASWASVTRASGFDTFAATPSSANLRALLSDEVGTGAAYFVGGALGTPASATLTNATGLPFAGLAAAAVVTESEGIGSNDNDTTLPTSAAVKDFHDANASLKLVSILTASNSATLDFDSSNGVTFEAGYDYYLFFDEIQPAADAYLMVRFGTGGTPTYQTTNYTGVGLNYNASVAASTGATGGINLQSTGSPGGAAAGETISGNVVVPDPATSRLHKCTIESVAYLSTGVANGFRGTCWRTTADAITGLRVMMSTNKITSGTVRLMRAKTVS